MLEDTPLPMSQSGPAIPPSPSAGTYFPFPSARSVFAQVCGILPVLAVAILYLPAIPGGVQNWWVAVVAFYVFLQLLPRRKRGITLSEEGIKIGKRSVVWADILEIHKLWPRTWSFNLVCGGQKRLRLWLPTCPIVLQEVLPAIVTRCPTIPVSSAARRALGACRRTQRVERKIRTYVQM
jgi:hypothetical protein